MQSNYGWDWRPREVRDPLDGTLHEGWVSTVPGFRYPNDSPVTIEATLTTNGWWVGDQGGAMAASRAQIGVTGCLFADLESYFPVLMSGDGHFYLLVAPAKKGLMRRIERAAMLVASFSALIAAAQTPEGWPPRLTVTSGYFGFSRNYP